MAPTKKSIYRNPNAQHFQLVHRSVRDPLANDPEASQQVFKPIGRYNQPGEKNVHTMEELRQTEAAKMRANEGEAALYGITYDDSAYDYMQHLKTVGEGGGEVFDSVLVAAPKGSSVARGMTKQGKKYGAKGKDKEDMDDMFQMPGEVMASRHELSIAEAHERSQAIPTELQGFNPDMDPHLRQVLEALDDDAFVEGEEGDMFDELLGAGELDEDEEAPEFEFAEWGLNDDGSAVPRPKEPVEGEDEEGEEEAEETWMDRFRRFKEEGGAPNAPISNGGWNSDEDGDMGSEGADTVGELGAGMEHLMVRGAKKRNGKRGPSDASGMSMSSASVYRNTHLRDLDTRFDKIERDYELDDEDEWSGDDDVSLAPSMMSTMSKASIFDKAGGYQHAAPPEISRDDFDAIMDDFLENYEVVGRRMRSALGGTGLTGPEKLQVLRSALEGDEAEEVKNNKERILELERQYRGKTAKELRESLPVSEVEPKAEAKWDVETILSTYTNTENHPGMIRHRTPAERKARAEKRAAAQAAAEAEAEAMAARMDAEEAAGAGEEDYDSEGSLTETEARTTTTRPKGESAEDRRARKNGVKAERAARRAEKKTHKEAFSTERKRQINSHKKLVGGGRAADVGVVRGQRGVISL